MKNSLNEFQNVLGSNVEIMERNKFIEFLALYVLTRKLWPQEEDRKTWKVIWRIQKKVPILIVHSCVTSNFSTIFYRLYSNDFLKYFLVSSC